MCLTTAAAFFLSQISEFEDEEFLQMKHYEDDDDVDDVEDNAAERSCNAEKMSDEMSWGFRVNKNSQTSYK